jgi:hypothetical protein
VSSPAHNACAVSMSPAQTLTNAVAVCSSSSCSSGELAPASHVPVGGLWLLSPFGAEVPRSSACLGRSVAEGSDGVGFTLLGGSGPSSCKGKCASSLGISANLTRLCALALCSCAGLLIATSLSDMFAGGSGFFWTFRSSGRVAVAAAAIASDGCCARCCECLFVGPLSSRLCLCLLFSR